MHEDAPGAWQLVCKIWSHWLKALGRSETKCPKISKNAKFWTCNFRTLSRNFEFLSYWTIVKFCTQVNMLMKNKFSKPISKYTLSWLKNKKSVFWWKCEILKKIQNWIVEKRLILGQWNFSYWYMMRWSPLMQNLMMVRHIVWKIWLKTLFFAFFGHFLGFLGQKTYLAFDI